MEERAKPDTPTEHITVNPALHSIVISMAKNMARHRNLKNSMNYTPNHYQNTESLEIPKQMGSQAGKVHERKHLSQNTEERYTDSKQCTSCNATHSLAHCQEASSIDHQSPKADSNTDSKDEPGWGERIS